MQRSIRLDIWMYLDVLEYHCLVCHMFASDGSVALSALSALSTNCLATDQMILYQTR
jgi:hypothetical protein